eukprot:998048_1
MQEITNIVNGRGANITAPTTWEQVKKWVKNDGRIAEEGSKTLRRTPSMTNQYELQKEDRKQKWVTYADFVRCYVFEQQSEKVKVTKNNRKCTLQKSPRKRGKVVCKLKPNDFPYNLAENVQHLVLFSFDSTDKYHIERMIEKQYPEQEYLWWRNPTKYQSIPDVWHVQVLVKKTLETS